MKPNPINEKGSAESTNSALPFSSELLVTYPAIPYRPDLTTTVPCPEAGAWLSASTVAACCWLTSEER